VVIDEHPSTGSAKCADPTTFLPYGLNPKFAADPLNTI